jgi:type IV secretory pathway VirB4 component
MSGRELTVLINVDVVLGVIALGVLALVVLIPELGFWQRAVSPRGIAMNRRRALAELLPYRRLIRHNVIKNASGSYLAAWRIAGADVGTLTDGDILNTAYHLAATIGSLAPSTKVQMYARRARFREYESGMGLTHPISRLLDDLRADFFLRRERVYHTERTIALTWQPPSERMERLRSAVSIGVEAQLRNENEILAEFEQMCEDVGAALSTRTLSVSRLGERLARDTIGVERRQSDLLAFVGSCVTGPYVPIAVPPPGTDLNDFLAAEVRGGYEPKIGEFEVSAIALKSYPDEAVPLMLDKLTELKVSHVLHVSFTPESIAAVRKELRSGVADFKAAANFSAKQFVDPDLKDASEQMVAAIGKAGNDYTRHGYVSLTLIVRARSREQVRKAERAVEAVLNDCMFRATIRRVGALDAILSTMPAQTRFGRQRQYLFDALTTAKMFPVHEASLGRRYAESESLPPNVPPLTYALGPGGQFFREHGNVKDVFHRVVLGRPGVGKSVAETYLSAMFLSRLPAAGVTIIDRGPSAYQACKMFDGQYYRLLGKSSPGFALFWDAHIPAQFREIFRILKRMCELSGVAVDGDREESLKAAIRVMGNRPRPERSMFAFWEQLQDPDRSLKPALKKYTRLGDLGAMFDSTEDTFETGRMNVIDVEQVMDLEPALLIPLLEVVIWKTRTAVRRMKETLGVEGARLHWRFAVDEVNNSLMRHPIGAQFINDMLLMGRKENFSLSLASNSVKTFAMFPGCSDIMLAAQSRVYFNDSAALGENRKYYEQFELPERGIALLPNLPDHSFVLHQPEANVMRQLSHRLDKDVLAILGTSRSVSRVDDFMERYPTAHCGLHRWKIELLQAQGAMTAAQRLAALLSEDHSKNELVEAS